MGVPVSAHLNGVRATRAWGLEESFNQLSLLPRERKVSLLQQVLQLCNLNTTNNTANTRQQRRQKHKCQHQQQQL